MNDDLEAELRALAPRQLSHGLLTRIEALESESCLRARYRPWRVIAAQSFAGALAAAALIACSLGTSSMSATGPEDLPRPANDAVTAQRLTPLPTLGRLREALLAGRLEHSIDTDFPRTLRVFEAPHRSSQEFP